MKTTTQTDAMLAVELAELIEARRQLEKREDELKSYWKTKLGNLGIDTVSLGGVLISLIDKRRSSLDKKSLVAAFGPDVIAQHEKVTNYVQVDVKIVNASMVKNVA